VNSRVEDKNQGKRWRYQERACGTEVNPHCEYVQQVTRVRAHRHYYHSRDAMPKRSYVEAADQRVIRDAAEPAPQRKRQNHYCETRLDIEIEVYTQE
jgi:hypothetical protein